MTQVSTDGNEGSKLSATPSARALSLYRDEIIAEWVSRVRTEVEQASRLRRVVLVDTAPAFLDNLAEALSEEHPRTTATASTNIAEEHGGERARLTKFGPDQLIKEYQLLRDTIVGRLVREVELTSRDRNIIQRSIDQGLSEAVLAFTVVQNQIREQFVAGLSHDLRNPLSSIKMSGQMIQNLIEDIPQDEVREDIRRLTARVVSNARRADRMIQDLLDASMLQAGEKVSLKIEECDMLSIVRDVVVELSSPEQNRIRINGVPVRGFWDCNAIRRAIENLVTNAFKYGKPGTAIGVRVSRVGERATIHVHNDGEPIPLKDQEMLFGTFRRTHSAKRSGIRGWGLGLALVRAVAESHGGSIGVESNPESGTTFLIDIPQDSRPFQDAATGDNKDCY